MDQLTKNVTEINRAFKKFDCGKGSIKAEDVNAMIGMLKESHAVVRTTIQVEAMARRGAKIIETLERKNLYSSTTAVDIDGDPETDKVKCPEQDNLITRAECLDYSGQKKHYEVCEGCEIGLATKNILCPAK